MQCVPTVTRSSEEQPMAQLLFANIQEPGHTFAISADFKRYFS
jgi:hypothetical protein